MSMWHTTAGLILYWTLLISSTRADTSIPTPFDTGYNYGLTSSCDSFFAAFLNSPSFQTCPSFGFLLTKSNQFNQISRNTTSLTPVLQSVCAATTDQCVSLMKQYASQMTDSKNCGSDLQSNNTIAVATLDDFLSYQPLQSAGCMQDTDGQYCYVKTLQLNQGTAIYYLPVGSPLPNATITKTQFQCNSCNSKILALYANYTNVQNEPITTVWRQALTLINATCGPTYLQQSGIAFTSTASLTGKFHFALYTALFMFIASTFL